MYWAIQNGRYLGLYWAIRCLCVLDSEAVDAQMYVLGIQHVVRLKKGV